MARIRTVKPEMAQDEDLAACSLEAQLLAVRLLNHADDEGYFKANTLLVKANCFPLVDSVNIHGALTELSNVGYLALKKGSDGKEYGHIQNFSKHQTINRPTESKIKKLWTVTDDSVNPHGALPPGKERKGKEVPVGADKPPDPKKTLWSKGISLLTGQGMDERKARSLLGKVVKAVGSEDDALEIVRLSEGKADAASFMSACSFKVRLPTDNRDLWAIRQAVGLDPEYTDTESCHAEIRQRLREQPDLRPTVEGLAGAVH